MSYAISLPNSMGSVQGDACAKLRVTGTSIIDDQIVSCCKGIKFSGKSAGEIAHDTGECVTRGLSAAAGMIACTAAGAAVGGPVGAAAGTAIAPLCGTIAAKIGGWVYDRVAGYNTTQMAAGVTAGALCGAITGGVTSAVCGVAAAEVVGWISDKLSPITEAIFDPGAAKRRELAARRARNLLDQATVDYRKQADQHMTDLWSQSVSSIKQMYVATLPTLSQSSQAKLVKILGFSPTYDGIAKALVAQGAAVTSLNWHTDAYGVTNSSGATPTIADRLHYRRDSVDGRGCETSAAGCLNDGYSEVCPFSFNDYYMAFWNTINWKGTTRDQQMTFEKKILGQMQGIADGIFSSTQQAITNLVTQIMVAATMLQLSDATAAAAAANDAQIVAKAAAAAAYTEAAAARAKSWSHSTRVAALAAAENGYQVTKHASFLLQVAGSSLTTTSSAPPRPPASASNLRMMKDAVARATAALAAAKSNALHAQIMMGAVAAAGVAGVGYLFLRRK